MTVLVLRNGRIFDGRSPGYMRETSVIVANGIIEDVTNCARAPSQAEVIDLGGRTLMPGFIDAHVHACMFTTDPRAFVRGYPTYLGAHASRFLGHALDWGFTTVRDVGGADIGLAQAVRDGLIRSPRLLYAGRILSQTGGHADIREAEDVLVSTCGCGCSSNFHLIVDGVDAMRAATREELRKGAHCIKIMASGGVTSPTDPLDSVQFSEEEIRVCVDEAVRHGTYVAAHCHSAAAATRCARLGVRSIEHGTMLDLDAARQVAETGAFVVPTLSILFALLDDPASPLPPASRKKLDLVASRAFEGLTAIAQAGVKIGFGTDLAGTQLERRGSEFALRQRVLSPFDVLKSATSVNAELIGMGDTLGAILPGAIADLIVVEGDPLKGLAMIAESPDAVALVVAGGKVMKQRF